MSTEQQPQHPLSFERAFSRLEDILEKLNQSGVSLEESLTLYEEADRLILSCHQKLTHAEHKIEVLIKNRQGKMSLDSDGSPLTAPFEPPPEPTL